jgi:tripartite ATP-independent transporter DctM subunit
MSFAESVLLLLGLLLILLFSGMRVAFALGWVGLIGLVFLIPGIRMPERMMGNLAWAAINQFPLTPVPLFILMGEFLILGRMNEGLYGVFSTWLANVRGGLCHATTVSCAVFAAMSGSSLATCATFGTVAGPEMLKRGYSKTITYGTIAAGGTLGILIPPSIPMIIYGNLAGVSIGHCFIAGVIPGILCTISFIILVAVWGRISKDSIKKAPFRKISLREKLLASLRIIPAVLIIFAVLGGIYLGVTTPTEAGAVGAFSGLVLCLIQRNLTWKGLWTALLSTVRTTAFINIIVAGASIVSFVTHYIRLPELLTQAILDMQLTPYLVLSLFYLLYLLLGMLLDPISMMVMTVPTILPTVVALGFDPIWFAVIVTMACEMGLITPPVGLNLYILRGVSGASLDEIALGSAPFVFVLLFNMALLTAYPGLALWLPSLM